MRMIQAGSPTTWEYRLARNPDGSPRRDQDGRPIVAFGPEHHTDPTRLSSMRAWWTAVRAARELGTLEPIFPP